VSENLISNRYGVIGKIIFFLVAYTLVVLSLYYKFHHHNETMHIVFVTAQFSTHAQDDLDVLYSLKVLLLICQTQLFQFA
jgi:fumarate reductase subunit D